MRSEVCRRIKRAAENGLCGAPSVVAHDANCAYEICLLSAGYCQRIEKNGERFSGHGEREKISTSKSGNPGGCDETQSNDS